MSTEKNDLSDEDADEIARLTDGYSGADMKNLCQEASLEPIRSIDFRLIGLIDTQQVIYLILPVISVHHDVPE